jgi:NAD dependent epimerase/dehydratase family enzyme
VIPRRLVEQGYVFRYPELEPALRAILAKDRDRS